MIIKAQPFEPGKVLNTNIKGFGKKPKSERDSILECYTRKQQLIIYALYKAKRLDISFQMAAILDKKGVILTNKDKTVSLTGWGLVVAKRVLYRRGETSD